MNLYNVCKASVSILLKVAPHSLENPRKQTECTATSADNQPLSLYANRTNKLAQLRRTVSSAMILCYI